MLTIAAMLGPSPETGQQPALRLVGAAPLAALMAVARMELGRERRSSLIADAPNAALARGLASAKLGLRSGVAGATPRAGVERS